MNLLAQQVVVRDRGWWGPVSTWGFGEWIIFVVAICAAIGIAYVVMTEVFHVAPPAWLIKILWIVLACAVAIFAIRAVLSM